MFYSKKLRNKINKLHERCLRIVYSDMTQSFGELLETPNSVSMYHRNIQAVANELCKIVNGFSPEIMKEVFPVNENTTYNTRNKRRFYSKAIKPVTLAMKRYPNLHLKRGSLF